MHAWKWKFQPETAKLRANENYREFNRWKWTVKEWFGVNEWCESINGYSVCQTGRGRKNNQSVLESQKYIQINSSSWTLWDDH